MYCQHCGAPLQNGAIFCSACGKRIGEQTEAPKTEPKTGSDTFGKTEGQSYGAGSYYQGNPNGQNAQNSNGGQNSNGFSDPFNTADTTGAYGQGDITAHTGLSVLAYFGLLVLIPICVAKDSPFTRFHCNQGLVLLIADIIFSVVSRITLAFFSWFFIFGVLLWVGFVAVGVFLLVLHIIGIVNAAGGKAKELPLIGKIKLLT